MGYIPLFLTVGGACLLFFMTVSNTLKRKLQAQAALWEKLATLNPELSNSLGSSPNLDTIIQDWKKSESTTAFTEESLRVIRELKINRIQYNELIKKAPYNWVAAFGGFKAI